MIFRIELLPASQTYKHSSLGLRHIMTGFLKHAFNPVPSENPGSEPTNVSILSVIDISYKG